MEQILFICFGWLLGLLSPVIIEKINSENSKKQFFTALCSELHDLQFRVAVNSFKLGQQYGDLDNEYLTWLKPVIAGYEGNEPNTNIEKFIDCLLNAKEQELEGIINHMRAEEGVGLSLKTFSVSFLESNIGLISKLPMDLQAKIHEFRNHLNNLNQEIIRANESMTMTFDSSITDENHRRLKNDLVSKYIFIQKMCKEVVDKSGAVLYSSI